MNDKLRRLMPAMGLNMAPNAFNRVAPCYGRNTIANMNFMRPSVTQMICAGIIAEGLSQRNDAPTNVPYANRQDQSYGYQQNPSYGVQQSQPYGNQQNQPYGVQQNQPYGAQQNQPYGVQQNQSYGVQQSQPYGNQQNQSYGVQQNQLYGVQQNRPYGVQQNPSYANQQYNRPQPTPQQSAPAQSVVNNMRLPQLINPVRRGQKTTLDVSGVNVLRIGFGWNVKDPRCDVDASLFALTDGDRVPGDDWLIFYSAPQSPDGALRFNPNGSPDRQCITVDLHRLNPQIKKLAIVLTIYEAFENRLNFSMISDAYLRVTDNATGRELVSYRVEDYSPNITSMTLGEVYFRNGQWKFNPVGNGLNIDLAGQCAVYGVNT